MTNSEWWRGAVIYQIYPRSFKDNNGDGIGDLQGVISKLDYLASLNIDAIWLSPFFTSPMKDFGYDISDYRDIDPMFGTLNDFKELIRKAHDRNLKVIIDQVYSHTSDQHAWFKESRQNKTNDKADWYIWADAKADGTAPNNWLSLFGGPAWQWDSRRRQYYMHNFLSSQPDLNFHCPAVQDAILDTARFWLELGVDGFRLDVVNMYFHDQALTDNELADTPEKQFVGVDEANPFCRQYHVNQMCRDDNLGFLKRLRSLLDEFPGATSVGEIGAPDGMSYMAQYTEGGNKLHMAYTFELLGNRCEPEYIRSTIKRVNEKLSDGWPCFSLSNHDVVRSATRWTKDCSDPDAKIRAMMVLLLTQRGTPCIYQGEELGLPEADVSYENLQDPFGIEFWPEYKGRDGCRTPMPWENSEGLGFGAEGNCNYWLPAEKSHQPLAASAQQSVSDSTLAFVRDFLEFRSGQPALISGTLEFLNDNGKCLIFKRQIDDDAVIVAINFSEETVLLDSLDSGELLWGELDENKLEPYQSVILKT